jgi:hypothetical protein
MGALEGWQAAYVAVTVALGDPVDEDGLSPAAADLARTLRSGSREARVRALAAALSEIALAVEAMEAS